MKIDTWRNLPETQHPVHIPRERVGQTNLVKGEAIQDGHDDGPEPVQNPPAILHRDPHIFPNGFWPLLGVLSAVAQVA